MKEPLKLGYKCTPLGWIPEDWQIKELGELGRFRGGGTPSTEKAEYWHGEIPWVSPKDMKSALITKTQDYVTKAAIAESSTTEIDQNSILIVTRSGILRSHVPIAMNKVLVAINQDLKALTCPTPETTEYVFQYLRCFNQVLLIQSGKVGTTVESLDFVALKSFRIPLPPLPEQRKIASVLATWDKAIETQTALIATLQTRHQALMQRLLAGKVRLKGFEGEWREVRLGDIVNLKKGDQLNREFLSDEGSYPAINGGISPSGYTEEWNTEANTITISEGGNSCGFINLITYRFWCGGHCYALLNLSDEVHKGFLFQLLKSHETSIMALRVGSGLPNIQIKPLVKFELSLPSLSEQKAIAQILSTSEAEVAGHRRQLAALKEQKKGLMQVLLTGKLRVTV